jgi:hypothetical protein
MPSYAHYYQTLIPHMPVPPGSIHLHTHSPSVLTSLSGSRQQAGSGSLRARSWCWALSGRNHFPTNSFTWKELLTGLTTCLFQPQSPPSPEERSYTSSAQSLLWPVCHAQSSTAWPQQPIGKNRHALPKQVQQSQDSLTVLVSGLYEGCKDPACKFQLLRLRMYRISQINTGFLPPSGLYQGILAEIDGFTLRRSGRMETPPLTWFISAIIFACTRVDTCHPGNCMRSHNMHPFCTFSPCQELRIKIKYTCLLGNNIKILFPGLSPLGSTLSPFFPPSSP